MGERGGTSGGGRYGKGGQQVGELFIESSSNEKIKCIYGNYGFWSWLRYWYLDTENYLTLILADKEYFDYDYKEPEEKHEVVIKEKSDKEVSAMLARFGFNTKLRSKEPTPMTAEEMQRIAMEENEQR